MELSKHKIDQILAAAGLDGAVVSPVGAGHYNDSYYLDLGADRYVLRIAPGDSVPKLFYEVDMMRSEVNIHRLVKERTNIPVPEIVYWDFSGAIIDSDYLVMRHLEGKSSVFDDGELGRFVRQLHSIRSDQYGYPDRAAPTGTRWPEIFRAYVELIFVDCLSCGVIDTDEYGDFLSVYKRNSGVIVDVPGSLLHLDLWRQNILTVEGRITGILDFDRGLYGDPELEFAVLDTYGFSSPQFFCGYGKPRPVDEAAQIRQGLYVVYELIKYAFIRTARGEDLASGRSCVDRCRRILGDIE